MNSLIAHWTKKWAEQTNQAFIFYTETTSTNDKAKEFSPDKQKHKNFLFITKSQTKGRGRRKRKWINSDMMVSWSYSLKQAPQPITTALMGLALYIALKNSWKDCPFNIKKPNDIYIKNKKMAGLLIEVVNKGSLHQLIIGAGMNVLTHPPGGSFTHLQENIKKTKITEKHWIAFLNEWQKQINEKIRICMENKLRETERQIIVEAICNE